MHRQAVIADNSAFGNKEAGCGFQQDALSGTGFSDNGEDFCLPHVEAYPVQQKIAALYAQLLKAEDDREGFTHSESAFCLSESDSWQCPGKRRKS